MKKMEKNMEIFSKKKKKFLKLFRNICDNFFFCFLQLTTPEALAKHDHTDKNCCTIKEK